MVDCPYVPRFTMLRMSFRASAVAWVMALAACHEATAPASPCSGAVQVGVQMKMQPAFGWTPQCGMSEVIVTTAPTQPGAASALVWAFNVPEAEPIAPSVTYGVAPSGATVWHEPAALELGARYQVTVRLTVGGDVEVASGQAYFVFFLPD